ncbi:hypothetical protein ACFLZ8_04275 [Planctomycetota bacterium]
MSNKKNTINKNTRHQYEVFSSNSIRLSTSDWIVVAIVVIVVFLFAPVLWERFEKVSTEPDFRMPYKLSNDYYLYERLSREASSQYETLIVGDSFVWGHYVRRDRTLSHYLNEISSIERFANLGIDGIHPAAMEGLIRYYGKAISNKNVILHLNPLWMSSPKQDLTTDKEFNFNHPKLVPQFRLEIPCYTASFSTRFSNVLRRYNTLPNLISHINITSFGNMNIPEWTIENPYKNPIGAVTFNLPEADDYEQAESDTRGQVNASTNSYQWVEPEESLQWESFRRSVQLLRQRQNRLFVLVGPFNEHTIEFESMEAYRQLISEIELWLGNNNIPYLIPEVLPADLYRDASHPDGDGYAELAKQLYETSWFESVNTAESLD